MYIKRLDIFGEVCSAHQLVAFLSLINIYTVFEVVTDTVCRGYYRQEKQINVVTTDTLKIHPYLPVHILFQFEL